MLVHLVDSIILNSFSIVILVIMLFNFNYSKEKNKDYQNKLFVTMVVVTIFCLIAETLSKFDGNPETYFSQINQIGNFLIFASTLFIPTSWFLYVHFQIFQVKKQTRKFLPTAILINIAYFLLTVISRRYGWFYVIDENNIYSEGPFFELYMSAIGIILLIVEAMIIKYKNKINKETFYTLLLIPIIPFSCVIIQLISPKISIMLNGVVAALLLIFINVQNKVIETDYLTDIFNRGKLDKYIENKIKNSTAQKTFSAILIDIDEMKLVNDKFGHAVGDELIINFAKIIKNSIGINDFASRISGDEFCVVLNTDKENEIIEVIEKIEKRTNNHNEDNDVDYKINFSKGYAIYDYESKMTNKEFIKIIDDEMYKDKAEQL